jgi:hypothetical protein
MVGAGPSSRLVLTATLVLALIVALSAPASAARVASDTYSTPSVGQADVMSLCLDDQPPLDSCARFEVAPDEVLVGITLVDGSGLPVSFTVGWDYTGDGLADISQAYCGSTAGRGFPPVWGATEIIVFPHALPGTGALSGEQSPGLCPGVATQGTVYAEFG